ncbi:hypothetical protein [Lacipirellula limnantheis]|nr:hypothetical protein [Lacipirellula limnantheis]
MKTNNRFELAGRAHVGSPARFPFNPAVALAGAAAGALLGGVVTFFVTAMLGVEWASRLAMNPHVAFSCGILGAWLAASFVLDDGDKAVATTPLSIVAGALVARPLNPVAAPRVAA